MKGSTGALPSKGIWPCRQERNVLVTGTSAQCDQPLLSAPASKSFFTAGHRASGCQKPQNPRGSSWHKNGENMTSPRSSIWPSRHQMENRPRINGPGDFQKAQPRCVEQVLREETILWLLWKESELLGKCLYPLQTRRIKVYYWKSNPLFQTKKLISAFLFRTCW